MPVFKNGQNDYQLDYSYRASDRLHKLDCELFSDLSSYLTKKLSWLFTVTPEYPVLKTGFITQEDAEKADCRLHTAISDWFKSKASPPQKEEPPQEQKELPKCRWLLITVVNNEIYTDRFPTYEAAFAEMKKDYDNTVLSRDAITALHSNSAYLQTDYDEIDWKIVRVDF